MAEVALKDKYGNTGNYESVKHIAVPSSSSYDDIIFTDMSQLKVYYGTLNDDSSITINNLWFLGRGPGYAYIEVNDAMCKENGEEYSNGTYGMIAVLTTKQLLVGRTYSASELGGV